MRYTNICWNVLFWSTKSCRTSQQDLVKLSRHDPRTICLLMMQQSLHPWSLLLVSLCPQNFYPSNILVALFWFDLFSALLDQGSGPSRLFIENFPYRLIGKRFIWVPNNFVVDANFLKKCRWTHTLQSILIHFGIMWIKEALEVFYFYKSQV